MTISLATDVKLNTTITYLLFINTDDNFLCYDKTVAMRNQEAKLDIVMVYEHKTNSWLLSTNHKPVS